MLFSFLVVKLVKIYILCHFPMNVLFQLCNEESRILFKGTVRIINLKECIEGLT